MQLWSGILSPFSAKVRLAPAEKGLDVEVREVRWTRETLWDKPDALLAANPRGQVPVLVDGDLTIPDSTVIAEYLEDRHPDTPLWPRDAKARARARALEDDADHVMATHVTTLVREVFMKPDGRDRDAAAVAEATAGIEDAYERFERALAGQDFLAGEYGLPDIAAFLVVGFASTLGVPPREGSELAAWAARVGARPAVARELAAITSAAAAA